MLLFGLLFAVFVPFFSTKAEENKGNVSVDKNFDATELIASLPPDNSFSQMKSEDMKRTFPFYTQPFVSFKINLDSSNKTNYQKGESIDLKGNLSYSYNETAKAIEGINQKCQNLFKDKSLDEREGICANSQEYDLIGFNQTGVFVQVWRQDKNLESAKAKGDYLVDEFYLDGDLSLKENQPASFNLKWKIPTGLESGSYHFSFFVNEKKNFSLLGFPVDVYSPLVKKDFRVEGDESKNKSLEIDKNNIKINDLAYSQTSPMQLVELKDGRIKVNANLESISQEKSNVKIKYQLYKWTQEDPSNILDTKEEVRTLLSGEETPLAYVFAPNDVDSFYTVKIEVSDQASGAKSLVDVHFIIKDRNNGKFMYLGMTKNVKDGLFYPIFCPRNTEWTGYFDGKIKLAIKENNKEVGNWEKIGLIEPTDGICFVAKNDSFKNIRGEGCLELKGEIFDNKNGKVVDSVVSKYNCEDTNNLVLENDTKVSNKLNQQKNNSFSVLASSNFYPILVLIFILIVIIILIFYFKKNKIKSNN